MPTKSKEPKPALQNSGRKPAAAPAKVRTAKGEFQVVHLGDLKADPNNLREHNARNIGTIEDALKRHGAARSIVVDESGTILAGNGVAEAAAAAGFEHVLIVPTDGKTLVAVQRSGLTAEQKTDLAIADNRAAELATGWKAEPLKTALAKFEDGGARYFYPEELEALAPPRDGFAPAEHDGPRGDDPADSIPEKPTTATTRDGDLWQLGDHLLLCADSWQEDQVARLLAGDGGAVDLVLTDPPYAIYGSSSGIASSIADDKMVRPFFDALGRLLKRTTRKFAHVYVHTDWRSYATLWEGMKRAGLSPKNCLVWDKGGAGLGANYANTHEFIAYFANLPEQKAMTSGNERGQRTVNRPNVLRFPRPSGDERHHNAAKPVAMLEELIENSSDDGQTVLDPFGGSGSTLMAAHRKGRRARLIEIEPAMCDVIVARWEKLTGGKAELVAQVAAS